MKKKKLISIVVIILLYGLTSCDKHIPIEVCDETTDKVIDETTEWVNLYAENYRLVSEKRRYTFSGDAEYYKLRDAIRNLEYSETYKREACIAIVTLTEVGITDANTPNRTPVYVRIDKVLDHNGVGEILEEGVEVVCEDDVRWQSMDDGTYIIQVEYPDPIPLAEVGAQYVVEFTIVDDRILHSCIGLPFDYNNSYVDTVAVGSYEHNFISAETMWYYDINPEYYYEYWEEHPEDLKRNTELGNDVYDKECIYFWDNR